MGVRDRLTGSSFAGLGAAVALILAAGVISFAYFHSLSNNTNRGDPFSSFYSDDDGQTFFKDSVFKFPPFDHNGKTAYGALVFADGDRQFVGYLVRFTPDGQKRLEDAYSNPPSGVSGGTAAISLMQAPDMRGQIEIKKPGGDWMPSWKMGPPSARASDGTPAFMVNP